MFRTWWAMVLIMSAHLLASPIAGARFEPAVVNGDSLADEKSAVDPDERLLSNRACRRIA